MRRLSSAALAGIFAAAALAAGIASVPLSLAVGGLSSAGLTAARARGTLWRGVLEDAALGGFRLGDVRVGVNPLALLIGQRRLGLAGEDVRARIRVAGEGAAVAGLSGRVPLAALAPDLPLSGAVAFEGLAADFTRGACRRAGGAARLEDLSLAGTPWPGLALVGEAACTPDGRLRIGFRGQAEGVDVEAPVLLAADGAYGMEIAVRTTRPEVQAALVAAGFEQGLQGARRGFQGRLGYRTSSGP